MSRMYGTDPLKKSLQNCLRLIRSWIVSESSKKTLMQRTLRKKRVGRIPKSEKLKSVNSWHGSNQMAWIRKILILNSLLRTSAPTPFLLESPFLSIQRYFGSLPALFFPKKLNFMAMVWISNKLQIVRDNNVLNYQLSRNFTGRICESTSSTCDFWIMSSRKGHKHHEP